MIYLDTSALMKLIRAEDESAVLGEWLSERQHSPVVTSELGRVEALRASGKVSPQVLAEARLVVADLDLVPLDRRVQDLACDVGGPLLRTLNALHLASALTLGGALHEFVVYDHRLADAARNAGLAVATPGQDRAFGGP